MSTNLSPMDAATRRESRRYALRRITAPTYCLFVFSALSLMLNILGMIYQVILFQSGQYVDAYAGYSVGPEFMAIWTIIWSALWLGLSAFIAKYALSLKSLRSYHVGKMAAILACIPCMSPCFPICIPFAIWTILVLNDPMVRSHYLGEPITRDRSSMSDPSRIDDSQDQSGLIGFILSLLSLFTCLLLAPVGVYFSMKGMKNPEQKGFAIAGTILGILGTIALVGAIIYVSIFGLAIFTFIGLSE